MVKFVDGIARRIVKGWENSLRNCLDVGMFWEGKGAAAASQVDSVVLQHHLAMIEREEVGPYGMITCVLCR